jgi:hypothetical protein
MDNTAVAASHLIMNFNNVRHVVYWLLVTLAFDFVKSLLHPEFVGSLLHEVFFLFVFSIAAVAEESIWPTPIRSGEVGGSIFDDSPCHPHRDDKGMIIGCAAGSQLKQRAGKRRAGRRPARSVDEPHT